MLILIVENDAGWACDVAQHLTTSGRRVRCARHGWQAEAALRQMHVDLIVVDASLADVDVKGLLERWRSAGVKAPTIVTSGRNSVDDRVAALRMGADDYLVKPYSLAELEARIDAIHRRVLLRSWELLPGCQVFLDLSRRRAAWRGREVALTKSEFDAFSLLARRHGQTVPRETLEEAVSGLLPPGQRSTLDVHLYRLRTKLRRLSPEFKIETRRTRGYCFSIREKCEGPN